MKNLSQSGTDIKLWLYLGVFLGDQCKEIEENSRMRKTRHLFEKTGVTQGIFHTKIGTGKDKNGKDLTEAEEIKIRQQQCTEELYQKKSVNDVGYRFFIDSEGQRSLPCYSSWDRKELNTTYLLKNNNNSNRFFIDDLYYVEKNPSIFSFVKSDKCYFHKSFGFVKVFFGIN